MTTTQPPKTIPAPKVDTDQLNRYEAHAAVFEQASTLLAQITTTAGLYATLTGVAWAVVTGNTFGLSNPILLWLLVLHILVSVGMTLGMWGLANNLIQRLNLARWLAAAYWPGVAVYAGKMISWRGIPADGWAPPNNIELLEFETWYDKYKNDNGTLPKSVKRLDFALRYRAYLWPSLRVQRLWAFSPALGMVVSFVLFVDVWIDGPQKKRLCDEAATLMARSDLGGDDRVAFDRARYLFDKAGCDVLRIEELRELRLQSSRLN